MRMSKKVSRAVVVPAIALSALALGSASFAASSYNVTAGSAPAGTAVGYTATTIGALPQVTFKDTTTGTVLNCVSASAAGKITVGTNLSGTGIGTVDSTAWNTCTGPGNISLTVTGNHPWSLNATGNTGDTGVGVTAGSITGINAHVSGGGCDFDVTGSVNGTYTNGPSTGTLDLPGTTSTLTIRNATFLCSFVGVGSGHPASFKATYQVVADNAAYNPIQITSNP